jgi:hypothetical protein
MQQKVKRNTLIKPAEYARVRGLNRSTVCRQIASGKIPTHGGLVDVAEADRARRNNLDQVRGRRKVATAATGPRGAALDPEDLAIYIAWRLCKSARETFPKLFAGAFPDEAYLMKHPETKQHVAGGVAKAASANLALAEQPPSFVDDTAARTGITPRHIRRSIHRAEADEDGRLFLLRVWCTWVTTYLLESWAEDFLEQAPQLPPIDWGCFGKRAGEARRLARAFTKEFNAPQPAAEGEK